MAYIDDKALKTLIMSLKRKMTALAGVKDGEVTFDKLDINVSSVIPRMCDYTKFDYNHAATSAWSQIEADGSPIVYITEDGVVIGVFVGCGSNDSGAGRGLLFTNCRVTNDDTNNIWKWTVEDVTHIYQYKEEDNSFTDLISSSMIAALKKQVSSLTTRVAVLEKKAG